MPNNIQFTTNETDALVRTETKDGIEFLVAPGVLIKEGVLNGELVLGAEIGHHFHAWNGQPLVVPHPDDNASANDPDTLMKQAVGQLFNVDFDGKSLRGELWIDIDKARRVDGGD